MCSVVVKYVFSRRKINNQAGFFLVEIFARTALRLLADLVRPPRAHAHPNSQKDGYIIVNKRSRPD